MTAVFDHEPKRFIERRPAVIEKARGFRERANNIKNRDRLGGSLDWAEVAQSFVAQFLEKLVLQIPRPFIRAENFAFHFLEFRRDETFAADGRLFSRVMRGTLARFDFVTSMK